MMLNTTCSVGALAGFVAAGALTFAPPVRGQGSLDERIARVEHGLLPRAVPKGDAGRPATIAERMAYHGIPAMSIAVIDDGRVAWARAYGVRGRGQKAPVTTETLFQAASLSKPVSAVGGLLLVQQGRLGLDDDVRRWLPSWKVESSITLRQLLSHSAGLSVSGFSGYAPGAPLPTASQILNGAPPANNEPVRVNGTAGQVRYSGGGYVVVQLVIAEVAQEPFSQFMYQRVLGPLGMTSSAFEQPLSAAQAAHAAVGHRREGTPLAGGRMVHPELAAAGLWTTPTDLARMVIALQDALAGRATDIISQSTAREMLTGRPDNAGLGVFLDGPNGMSRRFIHSGRNAGFDGYLVGYKNGRQGAVVMINRNNNEGFINEVLESVAREYHWPDYVRPDTQRAYEDVPVSIQRTYAGTYAADGQPSLVIVFEDEKLFARSGDDAWFRLYPASPTEYFSTENHARWEFRKDAGGASEVVTRAGGSEVRRRRNR